VAMEAFKAGQVDLRAENISKNWATAYDFPAVKHGLVIKQDIRHHLPTGLQGWMMNSRRPVFHDPLVRQALAEAYDFQWANRNLFYNSYTRTLSYFQNSDLAATGLPDKGELALFEPFRKELPSELFTEPFTLPVTDGSGHNLPELRKALALLEKAGWRVQDMKLVNAQGEQMRFTILLDDPTFERVALPFVQTLKHLGIAVDVRTVDPAQFQHLMDNFEYDMTMIVLPESSLPGSELLDYFSCAAAKEPGSSNYAGVCDPAVDALIQKVLSAPDRDSLRDAARALDRVLLWRYYCIPAWGNQVFHVAYWNRFGQPGIPIRDGVDFDTWWVDAAKAAKTDAARSAGR
jgi:microcin C transport system substrate-binding protein